MDMPGSLQCMQRLALLPLWGVFQLDTNVWILGGPVQNGSGFLPVGPVTPLCSDWTPFALWWWCGCKNWSATFPLVCWKLPSLNSGLVCFPLAVGCSGLIILVLLMAKVGWLGWAGWFLLGNPVPW